MHCNVLLLEQLKCLLRCIQRTQYDLPPGYQTLSEGSYNDLKRAEGRHDNAGIIIRNSSEKRGLGGGAWVQRGSRGPQLRVNGGRRLESGGGRPWSEACPGNGNRTGEQQMIAELETENRRLRMEKDILKKRRPSSSRKTHEVSIHQYTEEGLAGVPHVWRPQHVEERVR